MSYGNITKEKKLFEGDFRSLGEAGAIFRYLLFNLPDAKMWSVALL